MVKVDVDDARRGLIDRINLNLDRINRVGFPAVKKLYRLDLINFPCVVSGYEVYALPVHAEQDLLALKFVDFCELPSKCILDVQSLVTGDSAIIRTGTNIRKVIKP